MKAENNYLLQGIPKNEPNFKLPIFMKSFDFLRENESFRTFDLQRFLHTGYSRVIKVIDALLALGIIDILDDGELPIRYYRSVIPELLNVNVFYNGRVEENGDENKSGWDPSLFRTKDEAVDYVKNTYDFFDDKPLEVVVEKIRVGCEWEAIERETIEVI